MTAALALAALLCGPGQARIVEPNSPAGGFVRDWQRGDFNILYDRLSADFQRRWPRAAFDLFWAERPLRVLEEKNWRERGLDRYVADLAMPSAVRRLTLIFDAQNRVEALRLTSSEAARPYPSSHDGERRAIGSPVATGVWTLGGKRHAAQRSQRYAFDLRMLKAGAAWSGDERENASYFAYGATAVSPVDGVVVSVVDGQPDNVPGRPADSEGNSVTIKVDQTFFVRLAHLSPGSLLVAEGKPVKRGQAVAKIGNSGDSAEPQLHVEAFDGLPRATADAWPLSFNDVVHNGKRVSRAAPKYDDTLEAAP